MKLHDIAKQRFLFLQGPPGPFFDRLGASLRRHGHAVHRINLNAGDVGLLVGSGGRLSRDRRTLAELRR